MTRYHDLDALRAFAMMLGLVLHGLISFMVFPFWPAQDVRQHPEVCGTIVAMIHGFRMPLFFLLSGFFMMMLWKKRGPARLASNRAIRILIPLVVGTILVYPAVAIVGSWGSEKKARLAAAKNDLPGDRQDLSIFQAAKRGDLEQVRRRLDSGSDVNDRDLAGITALNWSAMTGQEEICALLIAEGADVNERGNESRTSLHAAAFFGHYPVVRQLLDAGAEVNVLGTANDTPLDSAHQKTSTVQWIASMLQIEVDYEKLQRDRPTIRKALREAGAKRASEMMGSSDPSEKSAAMKSAVKNLYRAGAFFPVFHHLWFLHYLAWFSLIFIVLAGLSKLVRPKALPGWMIRPPYALFWLVPLTWLAQRLMRDPFGPDTAPGILMWMPLLFYYGIFVFFGAMCFGRREFHESSRFGWIIYLVIGLCVGFVGTAGKYWGWSLEDHRFIQPALASLYVWVMSFALIGAFRCIFSKGNKAIRWLSDSSYWLYVAHLPLMMAVQVIVSDWKWPALVKFFIIVVSVTAFLLAIYHFCIRYTFVGAILNGKKVRPVENQQNG